MPIFSDRPPEYEMPKNTKTNPHKVIDAAGFSGVQDGGSGPAKIPIRFDPEAMKNRGFKKNKSIRDQDDYVVPVKEAAPYCSKRGVFNSGVQTTRSEHLVLYNLLRANTSITHSLKAVECWYKVRYSPARHVRDFKFPVEYGGLCVHPDKFLRDLQKYYVEPPALPWTKMVREQYQRSVRDYCVKDDVKIYGRKTRAQVDTLEKAQAKCGFVGRNPKCPSSLNGANGEDTGKDGVDYTTSDIVSVIMRNGDCAYRLDRVVLVLRKVGNIMYEILDDDDDDDDDDFVSQRFFCYYSELCPLLIFSRLCQTLNGNNGSWTGSDDIDIDPALKDKPLSIVQATDLLVGKAHSDKPRVQQRKGASKKPSILIGAYEHLRRELSKMEKIRDELDANAPISLVPQVPMNVPIKDIIKHRERKTKISSKKENKKPVDIKISGDIKKTGAVLPLGDGKSSSSSCNISANVEKTAKKADLKGKPPQNIDVKEPLGVKDKTKEKDEDPNRSSKHALDPGEGPHNAIEVGKVVEKEPRLVVPDEMSVILFRTGWYPFLCVVVGTIVFVWTVFKFLVQYLYNVNLFLYRVAFSDEITYDGFIDDLYDFEPYFSFWSCFHFQKFLYAMSAGYFSMYRVVIKKSEYDLLWNEVIGVGVSTTTAINNIGNTSARLGIVSVDVPIAVCQDLQFLRIHHNIHGFSEAFIRLSHLNSMAPGFWTLVSFVSKVWSVCMIVRLLITNGLFVLLASIRITLDTVSSALIIGKNLIQLTPKITVLYSEVLGTVELYTKRVRPILSWGLDVFSMINMGIRDFGIPKDMPSVTLESKALWDIFDLSSDVCATNPQQKLLRGTRISHTRSAFCGSELLRNFRTKVNSLVSSVNGAREAIMSNSTSSIPSGPNPRQRFHESPATLVHMLRLLAVGLLANTSVSWKKSHIMNITASSNSSSHLLSPVSKQLFSTLRNKTVSFIIPTIPFYRSSPKMGDCFSISTSLPVIQATVSKSLKPFMMYPLNTYNQSFARLSRNVERMLELGKSRAGVYVLKQLNRSNTVVHYLRQHSTILRKSLLDCSSSVVCHPKIAWKKISSYANKELKRLDGLSMSSVVMNLKTFNFSNIHQFTPKMAKSFRSRILVPYSDLLDIATATYRVEVAYSNAQRRGYQKLSEVLSTVGNMSCTMHSRVKSLNHTVYPVMKAKLSNISSSIAHRGVMSYHYLRDTGLDLVITRNYVSLFKLPKLDKLSTVMLVGRYYIVITGYRISNFIRQLRKKLFYLFPKTRRKTLFSKYKQLLADKIRTITTNPSTQSKEHSASLHWVE
jgi:hypothetical protein